MTLDHDGSINMSGGGKVDDVVMFTYLLGDLIVHCSPQIMEHEADSRVIICAYFG